jgi:hypothetical protein
MRNVAHSSRHLLALANVDLGSPTEPRTAASHRRVCEPETLACLTGNRAVRREEGSGTLRGCSHTGWSPEPGARSSKHGFNPCTPLSLSLSLSTRRSSRTIPKAPSGMLSRVALVRTDL